MEAIVILWRSPVINWRFVSENSSPVSLGSHRNVGQDLRFKCVSVWYTIFQKPHCHSCTIMTSSNGNIFRVTDPLWGECTGHQWRGALMFSFICAWANGWANRIDAGDLRLHNAHYDVIVMLFYTVDTVACSRYSRPVAWWKHGINSHSVNIICRELFAPGHLRLEAKLAAHCIMNH